MKIALLGYGKTGKEVEKAAVKRGHEIYLIIDTLQDWEKSGKMLKNADAAIDFSMPHVVADNIRKCFDAGIPVIVGTTGWLEHMEEIKKYCLANNKSLLYSPNFSIGANILFEINKKLSLLMNKYSEYNVSIEETHHTEKLDSPSGTAIKLAEEIIKNIDRKEKFVNHETNNPGEVGLKSLRIKDVTGIHKIQSDSDVDSIEIRHSAKNRTGLALGAVLSAEWIIGKKGFFEMKDFLNF